MLFPIAGLAMKPVQLFSGVKEAWSTVRWQMLVIFAFFGIISTVLVATAAVAALNVVVRRETANLIQERINGIVDSCSRFTPLVLERVESCRTASLNSLLLEEFPTAVWPEGQSSVTVLPKEPPPAAKPAWLGADSFAGIVVNQGRLEIRSFRLVERESCSISVLVRVRLNESFLNRLSSQAGLEISGRKVVPMRRYRAELGTAGEIEANFIPGSDHPIPVQVSARNWQTGQFEDWTICQLRPTYAPAAEG
jgi:hypothetical protein